MENDTGIAKADSVSSGGARQDGGTAQSWQTRGGGEPERHRGRWVAKEAGRRGNQTGSIGVNHTTRGGGAGESAVGRWGIKSWARARHG